MSTENTEPTIETPGKPRSLRMRFETVGSIAAIVVGVAALFVSWYQARVMQAQQHAAVWPILTIDQGIRLDDRDLIFEIKVENAGVGPAILVADELLYNGARLETWAEYSALLPKDISRPEVTQGASISGRALAPGTAFSPRQFVWRNVERPGDIAAVVEQAYATADLTICYCSVFKKCWLMSSAPDEQTTPVKRCAAENTPLN